MVPSRSRKTAGRGALESGTLHPDREKPGPDRSFHHVWRDFCHATMIRWAAPEKARTAVRFFLDDGAARRDRSCAKRIRGSENGDDRKADRGGDVHRAGIVADEEMALRKQGGKIGDRSFSSEVDGRLPHPGGDRIRDGCLGSRSEQDHVGIVLCLKTTCEFGESRRWPAFRGAVRGSRADGHAEYMRSGTGFRQKLLSTAALHFGNSQSNETFIGKRIHPSRAAKKLKIEELLVRGNFAGFRDGHRLGEEKAAAIASVSDAFRNIRAPDKPGGVKRVLQQEGDIEFLRAKFVRQPLASGNAGVDAVRVVVDELIADSLVAVDVRDVGPGQNRDLRTGESCTNYTQRRQRHDRIADPVRGTN